MLELGNRTGYHAKHYTITPVTMWCLTPVHAFLSSYRLPVEIKDEFILWLITDSLCLHSNCSVITVYLLIVRKGAFLGEIVLFIVVSWIIFACSLEFYDYLLVMNVSYWVKYKMCFLRWSSVAAAELGLRLPAENYTIKTHAIKLLYSAQNLALTQPNY